MERSCGWTGVPSVDSVSGFYLYFVSRSPNYRLNLIFPEIFPWGFFVWELEGGKPMCASISAWRGRCEGLGAAGEQVTRHSELQPACARPLVSGAWLCLLLCQLPPLQHKAFLPPIAQEPHGQVDRIARQAVLSGESVSSPGSAEGLIWEASEPRLLGTAVHMQEVLCIWRMKLFGWSDGM